MNEKMNSAPSCSTEFNMGMLKGLFALIVGAIFILMAYKIIANLIMFIAGVSLIYYGLITLKVEKVNKCLCSMTDKIKKFWAS